MNMWLIDRFFIKQPRIRRLVTRLLEGDRDVDIRLLGAELRVNTIREHGYFRSSRRARSSAFLRHEAGIIVNLALLLRSGDTFVDIGANVGTFSAILGRLALRDPSLTFHAFEANPGTYQRLCESLRGLPVSPRQLALSDSKGQLEFVDGAVSHVFTTVANASVYSLRGPRYSVNCARLDSLELDGRSFVLKIDVEGQELEVLQGAQGLFERGSVRIVFIDGYDNPAVPEFLLRHGFELLDAESLRPRTADGRCIIAIRPDRSP